MNTCPNCGKVMGLHSSILQGCVCQYSMQAPPQPEQKPVKWCSQCGHKCPLPPQRTWVGLTEDERDHLEGLHLYAVRGQVEAWIEGVDDFAKAIEAKLKEKNT